MFNQQHLRRVKPAEVSFYDKKALEKRKYIIIKYYLMFIIVLKAFAKVVLRVIRTAHFPVVFPVTDVQTFLHHLFILI